MTLATPPADILAVGLTTPIGLDGPSTLAAIRAGICRFKESGFRDKEGEPQVMSLVGEQYLPALEASIAPSPYPATLRHRLLQLCTYALAEVCEPCTEPAPLLMALPEEGQDTRDGLEKDFVRDLSLQAGVKLDERNSRVYRRGGASGVYALHDALSLLATQRFPYVIVGGADSFMDFAKIAVLDFEDRLTGSSMDGFIPGEGAGFLLLSPRAQRRQLRLHALAQVMGVGLGNEKGHRYSSEPYRGDGLDHAFKTLFAPLPPEPKVRCVYAGFNGENLPAKEWGVAFLRSRARFAEDFQMRHPADCVGDAGAALGPIMLGLAALGIHRGNCPEPCLVWSTSDREPRAAALVQAHE